MRVIPLPANTNANLLQSLQGLLYETAKVFLSHPRVIAEVGEGAASRLLKDVHDGASLSWVSNRIRDVMCEGTKSATLTDTQPYWNMVDAIGFFHDAHPGVWKYMDAQDCIRHINWSTCLTAEVLRDLPNSGQPAFSMIH